MITKCSEGKYILIQPSQIEKIQKPEFGTWRRETELEYKQLIEDSQEYFRKYLENPSNESYYIYEHCDAAYVFVDIANVITVGKNANGKYEMAYNGRHRLYVARKYKLPLLVCCVGESNVELTFVGKLKNIITNILRC